MTELRLEGPFGANPDGTTDSEPKFIIGSKLVTQDVSGSSTGNAVTRIYRYCRVRQAATAALVYKLSSAFEMHNAVTTTNISSAPAEVPIALGVPKSAITSPTNSVYAWFQTGGQFNAVAVNVSSALQEIYTSATAGYLDVQGGAVGKRVDGLRPLAAKATAGTVAMFAPREICVQTDKTQDESSA